ncbi:MAG: ATPase [Candidatus Nitrosocaldaceae archaeon]|nr:MAG: ATPase [Candidatus Nitrosocaldaceae archaeon]
MILKRFVLDTSIIIDGKVSKMIEHNELRDSEIIIPHAVLDELQAQASTNRESGFLGLEEIKRIREIGKNKNIVVKFVGTRPSIEEIRLAKHGRIDAIIKDIAKQEDATLLTADYVQALVAEAEGIDAKYIKEERLIENYSFEKYFDEETTSIHLKEGTLPLAKKGKPGEFKLVKISEQISSYEELSKIVKEVTELAIMDGKGSIEISRNGATVIQLENYRIAITKPPFSDGLEITIVRPIARLTLEDYKISSKLMDRLKSKAEGILIAGPPGSGKSTLASSLAEFYLKEGKIVKTFESPRDLQVSDEITQYIPLEGSFEKAADILLLVRPDYTIFDEVRKTSDFEVFADMRLAGVGMVGVVHASSPLDAIQRFMSRMELGMIPHIIDTIIFVKDGAIKKVYELKLTVRVPTGMTEQDLARPVVDVRDFENDKLEYEIYTFGEENVVMPVESEEMDSIKKLAEERIREFIRRFDRNAEVEIIGRDRAVIRVDRDAIPLIIGKGGSTIKELEKILNIHIDVEPKLKSIGKELSYEITEAGNSLNILLDDEVIGLPVDIYIDDEFLFSAVVGKRARIRVSKKSDIGKKLMSAMMSGKSIKVLVSS